MMLLWSVLSHPLAFLSWHVTLANEEAVAKLCEPTWGRACNCDGSAHVSLGGGFVFVAQRVRCKNIVTSIPD